MAISLKHGFTSGKLDGVDASLVQPSNWNSDHVLAIGSPKLFGRTSAIGATTSSLSGVTQANPGVFTTTAAHNLVVGQLITITGVVGMTQLNGNTYVVNTTPLTTTFTVSFQGTALNTSAYTAYSSGGTVTPTGTGVAEEIALPLTVANGGLGLTAGTSGGIPYFSSTSAVTSSAALAANALVIGGGAGAAPATTTTATGVLTFLGAPSSANLLSAMTDDTGTGLLVFNSAPALTNPTVTNYVETPYVATAGTSVTIDLANGTFQRFTISGGNATITTPTAVAGKSFILILTQDSTPRTVTWTTVVWPSGTAPTISTGSGKRDIFSFFSDGTSWFGATIGQNY